MLHMFNFDQQIQLPQVFGSYQPGMVILSLIMAVFMAMLALQTAQIARFAPSPKLRLIAIVTGTCALGGGIWITHFVGMLAFQLPAPVDYHAGYTMLSFRHPGYGLPDPEPPAYSSACQSRPEY